MLFTPYNLHYWSRKSGPLFVFSRSQQIWASAIIYTCPENLDQLYFHTLRKSGRVWYLHWSRKYGPSCIFTFPGNLGDWYLHWSRKSGPVVFSHTQEIWSIVFTGPENLDQLYFHPCQEIWWTRKSGPDVF